MDMCPERVKLEYIEGCSRYDTKTPDVNQIFENWKNTA